MEEPICIIEIDHTPMDVMIKDDRDLAAPGRAVQITTIQDQNTRCYLGFCLSFSSPTTDRGDSECDDS